jgi:hypothetical protein
MSPSRSLLFLAAPLLISLAAMNADAASPKDKAQAQQAIKEGKSAMKAKRFADAARALKKADDLDPTPQTKLELARALDGANKLLDASKTLHAITDTPNGSKKTVADAKKLLGEIEKRIPWINLSVGTLGDKKVKTFIDDSEVDASNEVPVDPGEHHISAEAPGYEQTDKTVSVEEGEHKRVRLVLKKANGDDKAPVISESGGSSKAPAVIAFSLGAVGLGLGAAFGVIASNQTQAVRDQCPNDVCPPSVSDDLATAKANGNVSTIAFIAGGVGVATGVVLLLSSLGGKKKEAPKEPEEEKKEARAVRVTPFVGPTSFGLSGKF